jgi:hypothetical protein
MRLSHARAFALLVMGRSMSAEDAKGRIQHVGDADRDHPRQRVGRDQGQPQHVGVSWLVIGTFLIDPSASCAD